MKRLLLSLVLFSGIAVAQQPQWIWYPEGTPGQDAPQGDRYFRKAIDAAEPIGDAWLWVAADDAAEVYFNGEKLGNASISEPAVVSLAGKLKAGKNIVAVHVANAGGPAGLVAAYRMLVNGQEQPPVFSDGTWKSFDAEQDGWQKPEFDDSAWKDAQVIGPVPQPAWPALQQFGEWLTASVTPDSISPNGDGVNDNVTVSFTYPPGNPGRIEIQVQDDAGLPVKTWIADNATAGKYEWDARFDGGSYIPFGDYKVIFMAVGKGHQAKAELALKASQSLLWPEHPEKLAGVFPIGVWYDGRVEGINTAEGCSGVPNDKANAAKYYQTTFADIKAHGFDTAFVTNTPPDYRITMMDGAESANLQIILELEELDSPAIGKELALQAVGPMIPEKELYNKLRPIVNPMRGHTPLLAFQYQDVTAPAQFNIWRAANRIVAAIDPETPGVPVVASPEEAATAAELGAQAVAVRVTPLKAGMNPGDYVLTEYTAALEQVKAAVKDRPYWLVLQAFEQAGQYRWPSAAELRVLTYLGLAREAKGVFFYLYNSKTTPERFNGLADPALKATPLFDEAAKLAGELKKMRDVLLSLKPADMRLQWDQGTVDVRMMADANGVRHAIICNTDVVNAFQFRGRPVDAASTLTDLVTGQKQSLDSSKGYAFTLDLAPGQCAVLRLEE